MSLIKFILAGDSSSLVEAGKDGEKALDKTSKAAERGGAAFGKWAAAAASAAIGGAAILVAKSMEAIDAQANLAQQLRTTSASMAVLNRTGDLVGISQEKITAGAKKLEVVMGQASAGAATQADLFNRLGLNIEEVSAMPLDQRILAINSAIKENIPVTERAAVSAQLFGEEAGAAFGRIDPEAIAEARKQAELFGTALSDVDAEKVAQAGDSFSVIKAAAEGVITQFTLQLAPVLKAIGDLFLEAAEEGGGMGKKVEGVFGNIVKAAAFVMDAADGIKRVFTITADVIIAVMSKAFSIIAGKVATLLETIDAIASAVGINTLKGPAEAVRNFANTAQGVVNEAMANIDATLNKPMAGQAFLGLVEKAKAASQAAAEAAVAARGEGDAGGQATGGSLVADEAAKKAAEAAAKKAAADAEALAKQQATEAAALQGRLDALSESYLTEQEMLAKKHEDELTLIQEGLAAKQLTRDQAAELEMQSYLAKESALSDIEKQASDQRIKFAEVEAATKRSILSSAMNALTSLMNSGSRKMFEVGKMASISQAIVATWTGATEALKLGWPLGPLAASAIAAGGLANVANIRSQQFGSGATGGSASMPTANVNAAATGTGGGGGAAEPTQRTNVTLIGEYFGRESVIGMLHEAFKDGFTLSGQGA